MVSYNPRAIVAAAYSCACSGKWSLIQVLLAEPSPTGGGTTLSLGAMWDMHRALVAALAADGLRNRAVSELRNLHARPEVKCDSRIESSGTGLKLGGDMMPLDIPRGGEEKGGRKVAMQDTSVYWEVSRRGGREGRGRGGGWKVNCFGEGSPIELQS